MTGQLSGRTPGSTPGGQQPGQGARSGRTGAHARVPGSWWPPRRAALQHGQGASASQTALYDYQRHPGVAGCTWVLRARSGPGLGHRLLVEPGAPISAPARLLGACTAGQPPRRGPAAAQPAERGITSSFGRGQGQRLGLERWGPAAPPPLRRRHGARQPLLRARPAFEEMLGPCFELGARFALQPLVAAGVLLAGPGAPRLQCWPVRTLLVPAQPRPGPGAAPPQRPSAQRALAPRSPPTGPRCSRAGAGWRSARRAARLPPRRWWTCRATRSPSPWTTARCTIPHLAA